MRLSLLFILISLSIDSTFAQQAMYYNSFTGNVQCQGMVEAVGSEASIITSAQTVSSTTLTAMTMNRNITLLAGQQYKFDAYFFLSDSVAAEGVKIDFNGGAGTITTLIVQVLGTDTGTALNPSTQLTTLAGVASSATFTGAGLYTCHGWVKMATSGTFIPRFAQNSHTSGTATLAVGSNLVITPMP